MSTRSKGGQAGALADDGPQSAPTELLQQGAQADAAPAEVPHYVSYTQRRTQDTDGNHVVFWVNDDKGNSTLAVAGHDPRGTGHFTYISTPELERITSPLKCTNRGGVLSWLEGIGVVNQDTSKQPPDVDAAALPRASSQPARRGPGKRRAADGADGGPRKRPGQGRTQQDENGISLEVQEAYKSYPELFQWVTAQPDEAVLKAFMQYTQDLSSSVCDEAPEQLGTKEDGTPLAWIPTSQCMRILDEISACDQVSLRLLQVTEIGGAVARLRAHVSPEVSKRAEQITARWRAAANATLQRANEYMQNNQAGGR